MEEGSIGVFLDTGIRWSKRWRSTLGLRYDSDDFEVRGRVGSNVSGVDLAGNGGATDDAIATC